MSNSIPEMVASVKETIGWTYGEEVNDRSNTAIRNAAAADLREMKTFYKVSGTGWLRG